ncbi:TPR repeat region-containing protein [Kribbella solani]|uniref:TPR repeat region-containing protein n=1 Tax=Kribbella solani TaxID=236067 RepID=UPI0029B3261E|nr:hypothetical protein [Kribbella solani]MDX2973968.1 hypothetical protein [Kribbella solani]
MADKPESGRSGEGDGFCGINPTVLAGVIKDLAAIEAAITTELPRLKPDFEKAGVSTAPINDLGSVSRWLHEQLPMLRRRQSAASLLASQGMSFTPNTSLLSVPEDSGAATKQAANLAVENTKAGLDGKPGSRDGVLAAVNALERIRGTKGRLDPDEVLFLETYYGRLGKDVYKLPGYLRDDNNWIAPTRTSYTPGEVIPTAVDAKVREKLAAAVAGALLTLSDESRGGGWNRLPAFVREAAQDKFAGFRMPDGGWAPEGGEKAAPFAAFLAQADPADRAGLVLSKRLAISAAESIPAYRRLQTPTSYNPPASDELARVFLHISSRNEQAMHDLLTGQHMEQPADVSKEIYKGYTTSKDFLVALTTHVWSDGGKAVSETLNWIADAKRSASPARQQLATQAWDSVFKTLTDESVLRAELDIQAGEQRVIDVLAKATRPALGVVSPEITRSLARGIAAFIDEVANDESNEQASARLFTLVATDPLAAESLAGAIYLQNVAGIHDTLRHPVGGRFVVGADPAGRLQALLEAAFINVAFELNADTAEAAKAADELRGKALSAVAGFVTKGFGTELPSFPGLDPVDMLDRILAHAISGGGDPAEPQTVKFDGINPAGATGGALIVRYNFLKALIESGQLKLGDLPDDLRSKTNPPHLRSPAEIASWDRSKLAERYIDSVSSVPGAAEKLTSYLDEYRFVTSRVLLNRRNDRMFN